MVDAQHLAIWRGNVEAVQDGNRLVSDTLNVYFSGKPAPGSAGRAAVPGGSGRRDGRRGLGRCGAAGG